MPAWAILAESVVLAKREKRRRPVGPKRSGWPAQVLFLPLVARSILLYSLYSIYSLL